MVSSDKPESVHILIHWEHQVYMGRVERGRYNFTNTALITIDLNWIQKSRY